MSNSYYKAGTLTEHTLARASQINVQFQSIEAAFDKLPDSDRLQQGTVTYAQDAGAANAYVVEIDRAPDAYVEGLTLRFKAASANTGPATINVNGLGVKPICRYDGADLIAADIPAGAICQITYDGAVFRLTGFNGGDLVRAREWAVKTGGPVEGGEWSAKSHAQAAAGSASAAAGSAGSAATSAGQAAASASNAAGSASAAQTARTGAEAARDAAAGSASAAAASETAAQTARTGAEAARDSASGHRLNAQNAQAAAEAARDAAQTARAGVEAARDAAVGAAGSASASAAAAEASADRAATFDPTSYYDKGAIDTRFAAARAEFPDPPVVGSYLRRNADNSAYEARTPAQVAEEVGMPSGTRMIFQQASAPTGWTKDASHDDKALRVVSGTTGSGGASGFSTIFGAGKSTGSHTLTVAQLAAHSHTVVVGSTGEGSSIARGAGSDTQTTSSQGSNQAHSHTLDLDLAYLDVIVAQKD